jgi:hypothetical protein
VLLLFYPPPRCTWDAFYSTVSARGLVEGLGSLAAGGLSPQLLIIDDGWQVRQLCNSGRSSVINCVLTVLESS